MGQNGQQSTERLHRYAILRDAKKKIQSKQNRETTKVTIWTLWCIKFSLFLLSHLKILQRYRQLSTERAEPVAAVTPILVDRKHR